MYQRLVTALGYLGGDPRAENCSFQSRQTRANTDSVSIKMLAATPTKMVNTAHLKDANEPDAVPVGLRSSVVADASIHTAHQHPKDRKPGHSPRSTTDTIAALVDLLTNGKT